jgi:hypothetical protein
MKKLLAIISLIMLSSCGASWQLSTLNHDPIYEDENYIVVSDDVKIDTLSEFQFRNKLRTDIGFRLDFARYALSQPRSFDWNNRLLGRQYDSRWNNYYWGWNRDQMWNDWAWGYTGWNSWGSPHRWSPFGYDRWGYGIYYGWNNHGWGYGNHYGWYGSHFNNYYGGWPYYGNNVYGIPGWRSGRTNTVYINGRRSSIRTEVNNGRRTRNTTTRRSTNNTRNNEVIINNSPNRNNNTRVRVYRRIENNPSNTNTRPRIIREKPPVRNNRPSFNNNSRPSNNSRPVINNSRPSNTRSSTPVRSSSPPSRKKGN